VKVTIEVPVGIADFFNDLAEIPMAIEAQSLEKFASEAVLMQFDSLLHSLPWTVFNLEMIRKIYGLREYSTRNEALQVGST